MTRWLIFTLLRAYPPAFRQQFGVGMQYGLEEEHAAARLRGPFALAFFWLSTTLSLVPDGIRERSAASRRRQGPRAAPFKEGTQDSGGMEMIGATLRDFRFATRRLAKRPGFSLAGIATLGLGMGATTAIFGLLHTVILHPLDYFEPERLIWIAHESNQSSLGVPTGAYLEYKERSNTVTDLAIYTEATTTIQIAGEPLEVGVIRATNNLFDVLGSYPAKGRTFTPDDAVEGATPVAVISHGFWQRAHGGRPDIVGRPVVSGSTATVVGVMPETFAFVRPTASVVFGNTFKTPDLFLPTRIREDNARVGNFMYQGIGRLTKGATVGGANTELHHLMRDAADRYSPTGGGHSRESLDAGHYRPVVATLKDAVVGEIGEVLWIVMGTVMFVLLIAASNVASLFVLRAESMQQELAVRTALGASRRAVARWFIAEGITVSSLGGLLGIGIAVFGTRAVLALAPSDLPRTDGLVMGPTVFGFALALSLLIGVLFGIGPVLRSRGDPVSSVALRNARTTSEGVARRRGREVLVAGQVAFALVLLIGSGLLVRTYVSLRAVDPGFGASDIITFKLALDGDQFSGELNRAQFMVNVANRVEQLPGVTMAGFSADLPMDGNERVDAIVTAEDFETELGGAARTLRVFAGASYLTALGAEILEGRDLESLDFADFPRVALVNETFARTRWPGESAVGRRIAQRKDGLTLEEDVWYTVVGVVGDLRERSLILEPEPVVYLPTVFLPGSDYAMFVTAQTLLVKASAPQPDVIQQVRDEVRAIDPGILVDDIRSLDRVVAASMQQVTFAMVLVLLSAGVALALGIIGIYGAVAYTVGRRTKEFGVRIALGATAADVRNLVLRQGGAIGIMGIVPGLVGAVLATQVLSSLLFGVSTLDVSTYLCVAASLMAFVLAAGWVPAHRATRVDPVAALSAE